MPDETDQVLAADGADVPDGIDPPTLDELRAASQFFKDLDASRS